MKRIITRRIVLSLISFMLMGLYKLNAQAPTITSFSPTSGAVGDTITIIGTGFNNSSNNNIVFFGATRAFVSAATSTSLTVTVPTGATFAPITVLNTSTTLAAYSTQFFNPTFSPSKGSITGADIASKADFTTGTGPYAVAVGDIDGDGKPDLAIANNGTSSNPGNTVSVLRNTSTLGTISYATKVDFATGSVPVSLAIGDIDGDGKLDLVVSNYNDSSVSVLRNTGSSGSINFATKVDFATGSSPYSVAIGDLNGDGKPDLAVANNSSSNTVSLLRNTGSSGTISFATKVNFTTGTNPQSVSIGDIDGDGKYDLVIANNSSNTVSVLRNIGSIGTISFATKIDFTTGTKPRSVAIGDMNGDGKLDLVISNYDIGFGNTVSVLLSTSTSGSVNFATKADFTTGSGPYTVAIGDIDGDGKPDLATSNQNSNNISVLRNTSTTTTIGFSTKVDFGTGSYPLSLAISDLDGDGKLDLAIVNVGSNGIGNTVSILRNNPQPVTAPPPTIISLTPTKGKPTDTVVITGTNFNITPANNIVFFGATRALVRVATDSSLTVTIPIGATYAPITILNTSTKLAAYSTQFFNPTFSPNKGSITNADIAPKVDFGTGLFPNSVAIGDIDGDGKSDLAIAAWSYGVSILRNIGSPGTLSFATKVDFTIGSNPVSEALGDIDGDGKLDLAVANFGSGGSGNMVSVLRNTSSSGTLSFDTKVDFTTDKGPNSVAIGDIDGDGKPDLVVIANAYSNTVSVLRNTGTSGTVSFANKVDFATGSYPYSLAIGDINGDGKPDLVIGNSYSNSVSVLRNTGSSGTLSFATKADFTTGSSPNSVAIGDIDGDGKPDLITANGGSNGFVSVFRNTGSISTISFASKVDFASGTIPSSIAIGDLNGDGKPDFASSNRGNDTVSLFRNSSTLGTIGFATKINFRTGSNPYSLAIGDIDGDGKPDFATANYDSDTVSVFRNNPQFLGINIIATFSTFTSCPGSIPAQQSFTISGEGLTANLVVTPPIGFEVSTTSGSGFGSTVSLTPASGEVNTTTIYIRLTSSATSSPSGNVSCTSAGVVSKNIVVSGLTNTAAISTLNISICPSALPYTWNGRTYNAAKTDTVFLTNAVGCDSIAILKLNIKLPSTSIKTISVCPSVLPYIWNNRTYNASKTDTVFLINVVGCDSLAILNLSVKLISTSINNLSICPNQLPYTWNGLTFTGASTQTKTGLINYVGCDSSATLNLSIKLTSASSNNLSICPSLLPYNWNGLNFTGAGSKTKTGLINSVGCDSSATLNLSIKSTSTSTNNLSVCPIQLPYTWNGLNFTGAGSKTKTGLINSVGCDSSATLNLTVKSTISSSNNLSICTSELPYTWNGLIFVSSDTKTKTGLISAAGCDSSATLILTVNSSPNTGNIIGLSNVFKLDTASYSVTGTAGSTFNWSVTKGIIQSGAGANQIQVKWNAIGTDTLKVIETSSQGCVGLQNKLIVNVSPTSGLNEINASKKIIIYPNPTTGMVNISSSQAIDNIEVFDVTGKLVLSHRNDNHQKHIELDLSAFSNGIYFIQTHNQNAEKTLNKVVISK